MSQQLQGYRISPQQRRLWKLSRESSHQPFVTHALALVQGHLDEGLFQNALTEVVSRNEMLRSQFHQVAGMAYPVQVIADAASVGQHIYDWRGATPEEQKTWADELMQSGMRQPFDLTAGALLRIDRALIDAEQQLVLLSAPAFCLDWQGMQNVLADLVACYATGAYPTPEEELPISYSAVSEWWNEMLETEEGEFGLAYWKKYDLSPVLQMSLVAEQMSSGESHFQPNWIEAAMEPSVAERIRHVAEDEGVSLPAVLHSAWQVLLERVTGQDSYMIGTACDGRSDEDLASVPGLFGKYVPVRCESDQGCTFRARIGRTDRAIRAVQEWQDSFSWEHQLVDVSTAQEPYFPFGFDCLSTQTVAGGGLSVSLLSGSSCIDRFDVRLSALQVADGLQIRLYFDASRYSEQEMQHLLNAYVVLVKHAVSAPDRAVAELGLLEKSEREQLLTSMQDTRVDFDTALRLHELFEAQVNRTPQQVAVTFGEESLTYAELNLKANRLALQLVNLGVGRGNYVGIFVERSLEMVIALLATLKAGAAYVPLDPSYPQDRIDFMVKDAQLSVLLTLKRLEEKISHMQTRVVNLDALDTQDASDGQTDADNLQIEISAEDPAYVIYTSGTTGQPKGVVVPHRAICNHMLWMQEAFPLQLGDSVLQKTPFSFDASVWEFYAPLLAGAELVIAEPGRHMDTSYLSDVIRNRTITTLQLVPTLLQMLLDEPDFASCMNLQRVFCGGEALTPELVARFFQAFPENVDLINLYGPTECCIDSTYHICEPGSRLRTVPIGKPIANAQALVLDERMQPVPVGVLGELYISGVGVALGYLHRPELTAERFVRHVFEESSEQTHLLYKTGDQVRRLSDGNLEYVGRADDQVKVRGFRIELGEIEKVIAQHDEVREAVVIAHEYSPGDKRLVGYFVPEANTKPVVDHLRDHLKGKLPDYMVPANLVILDELPLSPSGKVNRKALPIPELDSQQKQETYIAPRNPVEELLERIFGQVLHHEKVGVHDNFFDLGGHSLLATQVVSRIRNAFQIALPVSELFDDPTISGLGERVQRAMNEGHSLQEHPIQTASREQELPLSFAQQRLWFLDQLDPGAATYNVPIALRLRGPLDFEALERSLGEIVRRHESLRTTFAEKDGQAVQVIAEPTPFRLPMLDLAAHSDMDRNTIVAQWLEEEINWSFNLVKGPLFRSRLLHLEAEEAVLFLNLHHIVTDGWSMTVFVQELSALYEAFCQGQASPLPDLQVQYADFAVWQRDWLQGDELDRQLTYWTEKLGGDLPVLQLPTDRPRSKRQTYRGSFHSFVVAAPLAAKIKTVSKREEATLFMTLLAVYKTLLYRYTGQEDLLVGTPIANRNRREIEGVIGFFVNTLVLRTDLSGNPTFSELVHRLRKVALGAYAHQELPFEKLVEELQPERDMSHSPLFQAMFTLQNHSSQTMQLSGLECELIDTEFDISKFDLSLFAHEQGDELVCGFEYNTDLFDTATIERMSGHFLTLLEAVAEDPGRSIALLPMITTAEQQQLAGWNETDQPLSTLCLPQLFEEQVNQTPDAIALQTAELTLTFAEVNKRANQLAHHLQKAGVGPEKMVGLHIERSPEMIIGLLGIVKAGGAYVPIDPSNPPERIALLMADAQISLLLTQAKLSERLQPHDTKVIDLVNDWSTIAAEPEHNPNHGLTPDHLAYIIYTSGSTGTPKGVMITHRGLTNYLLWAIDAYELHRGSGAPLHSSIGFDLTITALFSPLLAGKKVVLVNETQDLEALGHVLLEQHEPFSLLKITPAHLQFLSRQFQLDQFSGRTHKLVIGGEALTLEDVKHWQEYAPDTEIINEYGPTETVVGCSVYTVPADETNSGALPIGRPIANTKLYVLDSNLQQVPIGIPGELYIGGAGVGRGYLNRPELTAKTFISDPFSNESGARLYKSGDLARFRADGALEFLGRIDHQVKIRGYRIELGEIESRLVEHPTVQEAVVTVREDESGDKRLVAYVVTHDEDEMDGTTAPNEWRAHLTERLPAYMVPSAFVCIGQLPLTSNGKVDLRALPAPGRITRDAQNDVAPRTATEALIERIWSHVLSVEKVSVQDNFFDLGGHSLLATKVISRIRNVFQINVPLRDIFEAPTVTDLAKRVEQMVQVAVRQELPMQPVDREHDLPLSFAQQRLWVLDKLDFGKAYTISSAVRLRGTVHVSALERSLHEIVRRHEALRTTFVEKDGGALQVIAPVESFVLQATDLEAIPNSDRESQAMSLIQQEASRSFDLTRGPLFRAHLLRLSEQDHVLMLNMHHIVSDGWSIDILTQELSTLYNAFANGAEAALPELPLQYADFAVWQRHWLQGEEMDRQLSYWKQQLGGTLPVLQLPTDRPRPKRQSYRGAFHPFTITQPLRQQIGELTRSAETTLFMSLLAAFKTLLFRYTGQGDQLVGTPVANRNHSEIERLIGFFVNTLVLRTDLSDQPSFRDLLHRERQAALDGFAHQDIPFEKLVEELQPERDMSHSPLFQVLFVMQHANEGQLEMQGLQVETMEWERKTAKFELTLFVSETSDGLACGFEYNTDLFDTVTIERMSGHFLTLLEAAVANPDRSIALLPMLTTAEQLQLAEWNETSQPLPALCLPQLFEEQVNRTPDAIALQTAELTLTFAEVNKRANQLAHYLQKAGVGPEKVVGLHIERSPEMIIGLLGIVKAGGAYVPIDPSNPPERVALLMNDAQITLLLTQVKLSERLQPHDAQVIDLINDWPTIAAEPEHNPKHGLTPDNLAYIIYTSGSTGTPKGVMITHRGLTNYLLWAIDAYELHRGSGAPLHSSIGFDLTITALYPPLLSGKTVLLVDETQDLDMLGQVLIEQPEPFSLLKITPAHLQFLSKQISFDQFSGIAHKLVIGGEALTLEDLWFWREFAPETQFINEYGPTETVVGCSVYTVPADEMSSGALPIGRPIANTQLYVLDSNLQPLPIGIPGELYIGGAGVGRGYLNRPELTAKAFLADPFSNEPGARLYKSGDLARYRANGELEYLDRIDHQVKIRGYRIELGEIETRLVQHPTVQEAVVTVREDEPGDKRLVAYVVPHDEDETDNATATTEWRTYLAETLPAYMVPAVFVRIRQVPLTSNGKVDVRALPAPGQMVRNELHVVAPRTPVEAEIAKIWAEVVGVTQVGVHDHFFQIGGHSLLAIQVAARIRNTYGIEYTLRTLFEKPILEQVAETVEAALRTGGGDDDEPTKTRRSRL